MAAMENLLITGGDAAAEGYLAATRVERLTALAAFRDLARKLRERAGDSLDDAAERMCLIVGKELGQKGAPSRAWCHSFESKRQTLSRQEVQLWAAAYGSFDKLEELARKAGI